MDLFPYLTQGAEGASEFGTAWSLAEAIDLINLTPSDNGGLRAAWLPGDPANNEWSCELGGKKITIRRHTVRLNNDAMFDAGILELAAVILRQRYGVIIAGDIMRGLTRCAREIREK